jgi:prepilin-type N-terminal cleavage/methylation domain-containing protein
MRTRRAGEDGFTLLETLAGLAALSLLAVGAWMVAGAALRGAARVRAGPLQAARVIRLDDRLRASALRIRPPWWGTGPVIDGAGDGWTVPYLDGDPARSLVIRWSGGVLTVDDGSTATRHEGFAGADLAPVVAGDGRVIGVRLSVEAAPIGALAIAARFGGRALAGRPP